ncbi:MAG: hypothetical protein QXP86_02710 [Nitrososphaerota archaeon]
MSEEEEFVIDLEYVDTPSGKVASLNTVKKLAEAISIVHEEAEKLSTKVLSLESKIPSADLLNRLESRLAALEKGQDQILAHIDSLIEAFNSLIETLEKTLRKD